MDTESDQQQPQQDPMALVVMPSTKSLVLLCGCSAGQTTTLRTKLASWTKTFLGKPRQQGQELGKAWTSLASPYIKNKAA